MSTIALKMLLRVNYSKSPYFSKYSKGEVSIPEMFRDATVTDEPPALLAVLPIGQQLDNILYRYSIGINVS